MIDSSGVFANCRVGCGEFRQIRGEIVAVAGGGGVSRMAAAAASVRRGGGLRTGGEFTATIGYVRCSDIHFCCFLWFIVRCYLFHFSLLSVVPLTIHTHSDGGDEVGFEALAMSHGELLVTLLESGKAARVLRDECGALLHTAVGYAQMTVEQSESWAADAAEYLMGDDEDVAWTTRIVAQHMVSLTVRIFRICFVLYMRFLLM